MRSLFRGAIAGFGLALLLLALILPAVRWFHGASLAGWELLFMLRLLILHPFGLVAAYVVIAAVVALVMLLRGHIGKATLFAIAPAAIVAWVPALLALSNPSSGFLIGLHIWAAGVTLLVVACAYMYAWQR